MAKGPFSVMVRKVSAIHWMARELAYTLWDALFLVRQDETVLFVDLGSNVGQAYRWFSRFYRLKGTVNFELFEPNPHCFELLQKLPDVSSGRVKVFNLGAWIKPGALPFYGLAEGGSLSLGGSFLAEHNSIFYATEPSPSAELPVFDFASYVESRCLDFEKIIVKMDIEGSELAILEDLIARGTLSKVDILYVEFHSRFRSGFGAEDSRRREREIISHIRSSTAVRLRLWH